jgi:hypothetical protein
MKILIKVASSNSFSTLHRGIGRRNNITSSARLMETQYPAIDMPTVVSAVGAANGHMALFVEQFPPGHIDT